LRKALHESRQSGRHIGIVRRLGHNQSDAPHWRRALSVRGERPIGKCRRAIEHREEFAPFHGTTNPQDHLPQHIQLAGIGQRL
jgi:hypothetical protein